jgi:hypothetical protein
MHSQYNPVGRYGKKRVAKAVLMSAEPPIIADDGNTSSIGHKRRTNFQEHRAYT